VDPETDELNIRFDVLVVDNSAASENLGDVSQVESVVTLVGSRLKRTIQHVVVHVELGLNQRVD